MSNDVLQQVSTAPPDETLAFTQELAARYNKNCFDGKVRVLEICYTDRGKTYQIRLDGNGSEVRTDGSLTATTRIDTPWDVWLSVANGKIRGDEALSQGLYQVSGDFRFMMKWGTFFGGADSRPTDTPHTPLKPPKLSFLLVPWISFWICASIPLKPTFVPILICAFLPLCMGKRAMTIFDRLTLAAVPALSLLASIPRWNDTAVLAGYLGFGCFWLISCLTKEPLSAAYVKYRFDGNDTLKNPLFLKTNYILSVGWGILYVAITIFSFLMFRRGLHRNSALISNCGIACMCIFTFWFQRWYPAHCAKSGARHKQQQNPAIE